jgi:hypothetical protein
MPSVGIFWVLDRRSKPVQLLIDACPVESAEIYGDFRTHGGHHDYWQSLASLGAAALKRRGLPSAPLWSEYEEWPRGRVVFLMSTARFIVYADRKLRSPTTVASILSAFGIDDVPFDTRTDAHYVSDR